MWWAAPAPRSAPNAGPLSQPTHSLEWESVCDAISCPWLYAACTASQSPSLRPCLPTNLQQRGRSRGRRAGAFMGCRRRQEAAARPAAAAAARNVAHHVTGMRQPLGLRKSPALSTLFNISCQASLIRASSWLSLQAGNPRGGRWPAGVSARARAGVSPRVSGPAAAAAWLAGCAAAQAHRTKLGTVPLLSDCCRARWGRAGGKREAASGGSSGS